MLAPPVPTSAAPGDPKKPHTALQTHVAFFDRDGDGVIWPSDTFVGFHSIGFGIFLSALAVIIINGSFSWFTWGTWIPDPLFRMRIDLMHRAKHGSDSETYNTSGEFDRNRFDYIFNTYTAYPHKDIGFSEGVRMVHGNRNPFDPFGWFAAVFEWGATYLMLWPADGRMRKEDVRATFDGSIFYKLSGQKPK